MIRGSKSPISSKRWTMLDKDLDAMEERFALEHKRFLEDHNPSVLRGQSDADSYLSSVGRSAAEMFEHLMYQHMYSPAVRDLPHMEKVRELESRRHEVEELIRHDLIFQPLPESYTRPYED
jgi:hypothetical protein